jgi:hypothetical protein
MNTIKFSHNYAKLDAIHCISEKECQLIQVIDERYENLSKPFLDYDTDDGLYKLPKNGRCLILLFLVDGVLFSTVRGILKEEFYRKAVGEMFKVEINQR